MQAICRSNACRVFICITLLAVVLGITGYLNSGLHRHDRFSTQPCAFQSFENSPTLRAAGQIEIPPLAAAGWCSPAEAATAAREPHFAEPIGRAPPANA